ncbi:MAG: serine/threonine-protein kinase [Planctomycetota bacterium]
MISLASHHGIDSTQDASDEPLVMRQLDESQKERLAELLDCYLSDLEKGLPRSVGKLTETCPELRDALQACVDGLEDLHRMQLDDGDAIAKAPAHQTSSSQSSDVNSLGDFEIHEEIGRGGMGIVYRATQRSLRRTVAIKLLPLASVLDDRRVTRFHQEAEAAASLLHPNIVPVFATGCERGIHFYAMRFIDGVSLADHKTHDDWHIAVEQTAQIAEGLHAAHELGIIHRDVKPSNLIIDQTGKPWITDFGLARIQSDVTLTQSGDVIGTVRYMSPEQARGESAMVDGRTDVYSLGVTLYEMLAGRPAYDGQNAPSILRQVDQQAAIPLRKLRTDLPKDLRTVVDKAMSNGRDDRYQTAMAFAKDLRRVLNGEPTIARPPTWLDLWVRFALRYRRVVAATVLIGLVALLGFAVLNSRLAIQKRLAEQNATRAQRNEALTREAIDRLGMQIAERLADIPAADSVRHHLLIQTLDYYTRLASQTTSGASLSLPNELDLAITLGKIGSFQGELGRTDEAIVSLQHSETRLARLAKRHPANITLQRQWAVSQNNLAQQLAHAQQLDEATLWFGRALANQKRLPTSTVIKMEMATTMNNFGQLLSESGAWNEAKDVFLRAITLLGDESDDIDTGGQDLRSTIESNLAGLLAHKEPAEAARHARRSIERQSKQLAQNPGDAKLAARVVASLNTLAISQAAQSEHASVVSTLEQAVSISKQLRNRWPDHLNHRRDLTVSLNQLGLSLTALQENTEAAKVFGEAATEARVVADAFRDDAEVQSMLASVLNNAAIAYRQLGQHAEADNQFQEAIMLQERATELAPHVQRYQRLLQKHQQNLSIQPTT